MVAGEQVTVGIVGLGYWGPNLARNSLEPRDHECGAAAREVDGGGAVIELPVSALA